VPPAGTPEPFPRVIRSWIFKIQNYIVKRSTILFSEFGEKKMVKGKGFGGAPRRKMKQRS
jgi:hypothetical protein